MMLRLSVNRCGFDMTMAEMRAAISDLTRMAGDMGEAVGAMMARAGGESDENRCLAVSMRDHRNWLLEQAELLREKLAVLERRVRVASTARAVA